MANLTNDQIQKLYLDRPRRAEIDLGVKHQERLRFHTETVIEKVLLSPYYQVFLNWITSDSPELLPEDKVERFKQLLTVPLSTIELTESIFSHLNNVFKGQDAFNRYVFKDPKNEEDWKSFSNNTFWETHGFQAMINAIDSVWVLDLPKEQKTELPEPRDRLIDISNVIDINCTIDNVCEWIIFRVGDRVFVYDDTFMRVYPIEQEKLSLFPEAEIPHGLGYTPARMFWSDKLVGNINKKAPLTNVLGDLDWLEACHVFKKYMEIANSYPILAAYEQRDDFQESRQESDRGRPKEERKTVGGKLIGPGSILVVPRPLSGEPDVMANPLMFINPDVTNLEFHVDNLQAKRDAIFYAVVGKESEATKEAINEKQVMASFESQTSILSRIAFNFKLIREFADRCKIDIRYGLKALEDICIDLGTKFFLKSAGDLIEDLNEARENGSHPAIISTIMDEVIEAKFRNDKKGLTRTQIIQELDPLPDKTQEEAEKIFDKRGITPEQFIIKSNLMSFVKRFEREQAPLTEFAAKRTYSTKIESILDEFKKYAQEIIGEEPEKKAPEKPTVPETNEAPEEETEKMMEETPPE